MQAGGGERAVDLHATARPGREVDERLVGDGLQPDAAAGRESVRGSHQRRRRIPGEHPARDLPERDASGDAQERDVEGVGADLVGEVVADSAPAEVSTTDLIGRWNSRAPNSCSSVAIWCLSAEGTTKHRCAARVKLPSSATATTYVRLLHLPADRPMTGPATRRVRQMRLAVEADDDERAVHLYRDVLGAEEELQVHGDDGERVTIPDVGRATWEISSPEQVARIDRVEVAQWASPRLRVAFEVADVRAVTDQLERAGAEVLAAPTRTPWDLVNSRPHGPADLQLTVFHEVAGDGTGG